MLGLNTNSTAILNKVENSLSTVYIYSTHSPTDTSSNDPDLLTKEYFLSSLAQRAVSRKIIIKYINSLSYFLKILSYGASGNTRDSYYGAVNLLAETDNLKLLESTILIAREDYVKMPKNSSNRNLETILEILIKAIACAYKIDVMQRFRLISYIINITSGRVIKAAIIDSLLIVADEIDGDIIKNAIKNFTFDKDKYICDYANKSLQELSLV